MKLLSFTIAFAVMVVLFGRAIDHELARAGANQGHNSVSVMSAAPGQGEAPVQIEQPGYRWQGLTARAWAKRAVQQRKNSTARGRTIRRLKAELANRKIGPTLAIRLVFGSHADAALRVAWCESRWWTGATNGQYRGLFQMGSFARGRYGHSSTSLGQARAAYAYFVASGRDWSPWECRP